MNKVNHNSTLESHKQQNESSTHESIPASTYPKPAPLQDDGIKLSKPDMSVTSDKSDSSSMPSTVGPRASSDNDSSIDNQIEPSTKASKTGKKEIKSVEEFIEYAYSRKGQPLKLNPKVEKQLVQHSRLDDEALERLLDIAKLDKLLAVPRQLLLLSRDIVGFPTLRSTFDSFIEKVMFDHPIFSDENTQKTLRNLPEAPSIVTTLAKISEFTPLKEATRDTYKDSELKILRRNATNLFIAWLACYRGMSLDELTALLFDVIWLPASKRLTDDNSRLRALTEIEQISSAGLACSRFKTQAQEARVLLERSQSEVLKLKAQISEAETLRLKLQESYKTLESELKTLREQSAAQIDELQRKHAQERTHLHHDREQLGGRLVRRLTDAVETLEVGLSALKHTTPRIPVMLERAEIVVDALKLEIKNLEED